MVPDARDDPAPDAQAAAAETLAPHAMPALDATLGADAAPALDATLAADAIPAPDATGAPADPAEAVAAELRQAVEELDGLAERPLEDHVAMYERLHARMHTALRTVEE